VTHDRGEYLFGSTRIVYAIERSSRRRTLSVVIDRDAGVLVKAPSGLATKVVQAAVGKKAGWIVQRLATLQEGNTHVTPREFVGGENHWLLGLQYRLRIVEDARCRRGHGRVDGRFVRVEIPMGVAPNMRRDVIRSALLTWYRDVARQRLPERAAVYADRLGMAVPPILVCDQEKRWGSCTRTGKVRLNWRLIMAPLALVDYVVAHEVCHLLRPDHSPGFWKLLGSVMPDYEERRERLRVEGVRYQV
jgi:hypothetical protein